MNIFPGNAQHIGDRSEQQDSFGFSNIEDKHFSAHGGVLMLLADGMGGMVHGRESSRLAVRTMLEAYMNKGDTEGVFSALERSLHQANQAVLNMARDKCVEAEAGTTLVAAVVKDGQLYWISAGDSRLYLFRKNSLTRLTNDHIYATDLATDVRNGKISPREAEEHPERQALTSFLGLPELSEIDRNVRPFPLEPGDVVMLCSDGLYTCLSEKEMADAITCGDPQAASEEIVRIVLGKKHPHQDNMTVTMLSLSGPNELRTTKGKNAFHPPHAIVLIIGIVLALSAWIYWNMGTGPAPHEGAINVLPMPSDINSTLIEPDKTAHLPPESSIDFPAPGPENGPIAQHVPENYTPDLREIPESSADTMDFLSAEEPDETTPEPIKDSKPASVTSRESGDESQ